MNAPTISMQQDVTRLKSKRSSFSMLIRVANNNLQWFTVQKTGELNAHAAGQLLSFAREVRSLSKNDRAIVIAGLEFVIEQTPHT